MVALLSIVGVRQANAYTTDDLESDGWEKVTSLEDVSNNFYVIVDNGGSFMVGLDGTLIKYKTAADPASNLNMVWALEAHNTSYGLRNLSSTKLLLQTEYNAGWNANLNDQPNVCEWTDWKFAYASSVWTIENGRYPYQNESASDTSPYPGYWGPWDSGVVNDKRLAGNKNQANRGTFQIYRMSKGEFISLLLSKSTPSKSSPVNLSVATAGLTNSTSGWTKDFVNFTKNYQANRSNGKNTDSYSNWGFLEAWNNGVTFTGSLTANLNTLPSGLYKITSHVFKNTTDVVSFTAGDNNVSTAFSSDNDKFQEVSVDNVNVNNGNALSFGLDITGATWIGITDIQILYYGPTVSGEATALPVSGDMVADTWYYIDIPAAADNYNATATTLGDIVYTTDGSILIEDEGTVIANFAATDNSLSATRYYVKSSSANNLVIAAASYSYEVSAASADISIVQTGNIVTVSFVTSTNEPGAILSRDYSGVTFDGAAISTTPTANGFTFTVPTVSTNTAYTLAIPAGAIGYATGSTYNAAQNIVLNTPAVFDGTYYLKSGDKYLSRGGSYNTQAIADSYGIPLIVRTNASGITEFIFVDNYFHLFDAQGGNLFTDNNTLISFAVEPTTGGFFVLNKNTSTSPFDGKLYIDTADGNRVKISDSNSTVWTFEDATTSAHKTQMQAVKDAQAATVATTAGISASTQAELAAELASNYVAVPIAVTGTGGTVRESWQQEATNTTGNELQIFTEETVSSLTPGLYKLSVNAFERITWFDDVFNAGGAPGLTYVYANSNKTQLCSITDAYKAGSAWSAAEPADVEKSGNYYANNTTSSNAAFSAGNYTNDVYVIVTDEGDGTGSIRFGIRKPHRYGNVGSRGCWVCYNNFTLTYYQPTVKVEVTAAGYATYSNPDYALDLANISGGTAYIIDQQIAGGYISLTEQTTAVPAGTGLLIKADGGAAGTVTIPVAASGAAPATNYLLPGTGARVADGNYVFAYENGTFTNPGFYVLDAATVVPAGKAYLSSAAVPAGAKAFFIPFEGGTATAIEAPAAAEAAEDGVLYNTAGQQVGKDYKGIVIKNGKKYFQK